MRSAAYPIGVFDSGVGGLSVLREIRRELPAENLIYVADSAHAPYGDKAREFIEARSFAITRFLLHCGAKAIVVACNTATGAAVTSLRSHFTLPIVAMEPAIKPAAAQTTTGVIGVLATRRTLAGQNFVKLFARYGSDVEILAQACPGLVEQVEAGDLAGEKTRDLLENYVIPLVARGADTLVLGCTHYPFLRPLIQEIAGPNVVVIDSSDAVARQLRHRLVAHGLLADTGECGVEQFWTSADPTKTAAIIAELWKPDIKVAKLLEPDSQSAG
ncbi:glutamate racemase [Methylomicrobium sp. Wu6]|uniref:glutamate racemase n=1 Tax=Methylomicrobium sp. Wu6 TaxID=3107928 RepID=UPI002DD68D50|nr:glutamate racemase [Methylomicrobium sp. Wu6]MEC4749104.1 glutamate racemase [Methylomicrobium sp. Wu6]